MAGSLFLHMATESIRKNYVRLTGELNVDYKLGPDYSYVECLKIKSKKRKLEVGDFIQLIPTVTVNPTKCKLLLVINRKLAEVGQVSYQSMIESGDEISINIKVEQAFNLNDIDWLCRLYAIYG